MNRRRDEIEERDVEELFGELGKEVPAPPADELRELARWASSAQRSLEPANRMRLQPRWAAVAVATALLAASGLGFGVGSSLSGPRLGPASEFGAFVLAGDAIAAPAAVSTRSCAPAGPFFSVHIVGKKEGSFHAQPWVFPELFAGIPPGQSFVSVWSFGTQETRGPALYGSMSGGRSRFTWRCKARTVPAPYKRDLGPTIRVKDGWATGGRFECSHRGRFVIQTEQLGDRVRMAVWIEKSRELVALAESRDGSAWARVSKRCVERNL